MARKLGSNSKNQLAMKRIRFEKQGELMVSRIFSDSKRVVRLVINPEVMVFHIIDAVTGHIFVTGGDNINNLEVLQRHAKRALEKFLDANFMVEKKKVARTN